MYEFETRLDDYYHDKLYEIRSLSPHSAVCDFFLIRNDILNLKKFAKSRISGISENKFLRGTINSDIWNNEWYGQETSLPEVFRESISFFKTAVNNLKKESFPFIIDLICDCACLRYIENFSNEINVEIIKQYLKIYQLVQGLKIIRRAMLLKLDRKLPDQYFLGGFDQTHVFHKLVLSTTWASEKMLDKTLIGAYCNTPLLDEYFTQMLSSNLFPKISFRYEVVTDNYLLDMIRPVKFIPFGPERVFGYICGLTTEVFNLKLVLGGKIHGIENTLLRERLRKTYV